MSVYPAMTFPQLLSMHLFDHIYVGELHPFDLKLAEVSVSMCLNGGSKDGGNEFLDMIPYL